MSTQASNSSSSPVSGLSEPNPSPPTSPSIALSSTSPETVKTPTNGTRSSRTRARGSISKVCDVCKNVICNTLVRVVGLSILELDNRKLTFGAFVFAGSTRDDVCTYTRYSLSVKFPKMSGHDLNLVSQLLNELKESKTTASVLLALTQHSGRLGINLDDLLNLEDARQRFTSSPLSSAEEEEDAEEEDEDEENDDSSFRLHCSTSALTPSIGDVQVPSTPRHSRRTRANSNSTHGHFAPSSISNRDGGGLPSLHTGAQPSPLPPFSVKLVDPLAYHFPSLQLSKMNGNVGESGGENVVN
ncbi:hypothetical protein JCM3765_004259 [Sporobolomyces pararoseus]